MQLSSNGLRFEVDDSGPAEGPPVLMIMGLGLSLTAWPDLWLDALRGAGHRVLRFDNRDIGLSSWLDTLGRPRVGWQFVRSQLGLPVQSPYTLQDMAQDALGLLDALGLARAHLIGVSMGGMIAQRLAATAGGRVASLTSIMSSSGAPGLPGPRSDIARAMLSRPRSRDPEDIADHTVALLRRIGSPVHPQDWHEVRARVLADVRRAHHPAGVARQLLAVAADTNRHRLLPRITCPTLVLHGTADPLVPLACGRDTAARIPRARFEAIEGMGHDWPPAVARHVADRLVAHLRAAEPGPNGGSSGEETHHGL